MQSWSQSWQSCLVKSTGWRSEEECGLRLSKFTNLFSVFHLQIVDIYQKIVAAKQDRKVISKSEREVAWKAVRDREQLVKSLDALEQRR